jgi:hypothetical protein
MKVEDFIDKYSPCLQGAGFALNYKKMSDVWDALVKRNGPKHNDWLIWLFSREGICSEKEQRLFAVWCCRKVLHLMADHRSRHAVEVAEKYANGEASVKELSEAKEAAKDAESDSERYGELLSARATKLAAGLGAGFDAGNAALISAVLFNEWKAEVESQADYIRKNIKNPFKETSDE